MKRLHGAVLGLCLLAGPALADDCKQLAIVTSVDLQTDKDHDAVFAPVTLDGKNELLQVDTGANLSEISKDVADDLGLDREPVNVAVIDVSGRASNLAGRVKSFAMGNLHASNVDFMLPKDNPFGEGNKEIAGLLGADILSNYDVEIDFGADKLSLLSPDHCPGKVIYWPATAAAVVPIQITKDGDITFPVTLDGHPVNATLDTGAYHTVVNLGFAENTFGINATTPGVTSAGALENTHGSVILQTRFKTLTLGDDANGSITVGNPQADLIANFMGNSDIQGPQHTGSRLKPRSQNVALPDMLLGMNVLKHLHIYIAYGEQKLYITPASAPVVKP
jgi:predicted aspartyl protease